MLSIASLLKESKTYLDKPYIKVSWHPGLNLIIHDWKGFATFEEILVVGQRTLSAVQMEHATKVLYDTRGMEALDDRSTMYVAGEFTMKMIRAGIHYSATIMPADPFAQYSIESIKDRMERHLPDRVKYFETARTALRWLASMNASPSSEGSLVKQ